MGTSTNDSLVLLPFYFEFVLGLLKYRFNIILFSLNLNYCLFSLTWNCFGGKPFFFFVGNLDSALYYCEKYWLCNCSVRYLSFACLRICCQWGLLSLFYITCINIMLVWCFGRFPSSLMARRGLVKRIPWWVAKKTLS